MEYSVVSKIIDLLVERCKDAFSGLKGKIKLHCIKKNLENEVFNEILSAHGDKVFYNDLDRFLVDNDVICNIIRNCCDTSVFHYKSNSQTIIIMYICLQNSILNIVNIIMKSAFSCKNILRLSIEL